MDHRVSKDMISSGMTPSGQKNQKELGGSQYGSAATPNSLVDAYRSIYEHHQKDENGNTVPHDEDVKEGKINPGLQAYLDKKKGKKGGDDEDHDDEKKGKKGKGGKPDFLDLDKDGDTKEPMKKAAKEKKESVDLVSAYHSIYEKSEPEIVDEENLDEALPLLAAPLVAKGLVALKGGLAAAKATKAGMLAAKGIKAGAAALKAGGAAAKAGVKSGGQFAKGLTTAKPTGLSKITQSGGKLLGGSKVSAAQKAGAGLRSGLKSAATPTNALLATSMIPQGGGAAQPKPPKLYSDVDLFDIVQGILVNEGVEEKDTATMMLSITPEELQIIQDEINEIGEDVIIERLGLRTAQKALAKGSYYAQKADKAIDKAGGVKGAAKKLDKKYGIKDKLVGKTGAGMATRAAGVLGATYLKGRSDESESRRPSKNTGFSSYDKDF